MKSNRLWFLAIGSCLAAVLLALDAVAPSSRRIVKIVGNDASCYFGTAHSLLFDRDFDLTNQFAVLKPPTYHLMYKQPQTGLPGSPYAVGYSLLEIPFLAVGVAEDRLAGRTGDGYQRGALTAYFLGNILFVTLGLMAAYEALHLLGRELFPGVPASAARDVSLVATLALLPATTLGYYTFSPMSHAAGFLTVSLFFWAWLRARQSNSTGRWLLAGILGGFAVLCRWQNLLLLPVPLAVDLLSGEWRKMPWPRVLKSRMLYLLGTIPPLLPQFAQWKAIYGHYLLIPQGNRFIQFPPRFIPKVLFSSQHGWFVWTPLCLLCVLGLIWACARRPAIFLPWTIALAAEIVLIGSMPTDWSQGQSFGIRLMTCTLAITASGLLYLLLRASRRWRVLVWGAVGLASLFSTAFAFQYRFDLLPQDDRLTASELLYDKLSLKRAYERRSVARRCDSLVKAGQSTECVRIVEDAVARLGTDRFLNEALVRARHASGDREGEARARERLEAFLARRLW